MPSRNSEPARFVVEAASRLPVVGRDYDASMHRFRASYVFPESFAIKVDAFPGMTLMTPRGDQQAERGERPADLWKLGGPLNTTGWEFEIDGRVEPGGLIGRPTPFKAAGKKTLATMVGQFTPETDRNAWNWTFQVPGPGTYTVTVHTLVQGQQVNTRTHDLKLRERLVVSVGDSAASGEGSPDVPGKPEGFDPDIQWWEALLVPVAVYALTAEAIDWGWNRLKREATTATAAADASIDMDPAAVWMEPRAHRSMLGGHSRGAGRLENRAAGTVVTYLPFGRSGATILNGLIGPRSGGDLWADGRGQMQEVLDTVGQRRIDALMIYIGINDIGGPGTLSDLIKMDLFEFVPPGNTPQQRADRRAAIELAATTAIANMPPKFDALKALVDQLNVNDVYLTEYPTSLFDQKGGQLGAACGIFDGTFLRVDPLDAALVKSLIEAVNAKLRSESRRLGWGYIGGIARSFTGRGYCAPGRYYVQAEESLVIQGDTRGTIHPNVDGSKEIAKRVAVVVKAKTFDQLDSPTTGSGPGPATPVPGPARAQRRRLREPAAGRRGGG